MPHYYKDSNNQIHVLDSKTFEHVLPSGCILLTDAEAALAIATATKSQFDEFNSLLKPYEFAQGIKSGLGGAVYYPLFFAAIQEQDWPSVQALAIDAHTKTTINDAQYAEIKLLATTYNIPVQL